MDPANSEPEEEEEEPEPLKSCLRKKKGTKFKDRGRKPIYSPSPEEFGEEREANIFEWKEGYWPGIIPTHIRKRRRATSFNPHFWVYPPSKLKRRQNLHVRLGVIELSLQSGMGARYRMIPAPKDSFDFPMHCVSKFVLGSSCGVDRLRTEAYHEIVSNWDMYKWEIKHTYAFDVQFFRSYEPHDPDPEVQSKALFFYKFIMFHKMFECKHIELRVACNLHNTNFYCIEAIEEEQAFNVIPSPTNFNRSMYFFAKSLDYSGRMYDPDVGKYDSYLLVWLEPIIRAGQNLQLKEGVMKVTHSVSDIGYFHLLEEDPADRVDEFNYSNNFVRKRHRRVKISPIVHQLHYYYKHPFHCWGGLMRLLGCWPPREIDERILKYNPLMINRHLQLEREFVRMTEIGLNGYHPLEKLQIKHIEKKVEDFLASLKTPTVDEEANVIGYKTKLIHRIYDRKQGRLKKKITEWNLKNRNENDEMMKLKSATMSRNNPEELS